MKKKIIFMVVALLVGLGATGQVKRVGIIGLDTSHSLAFTEMLNDKTGKYPAFEGYEITVAYPYGSTDIESSYERIPSYIEKVTGMGVEIVASIGELLKQVDYVLLETNDGKPHLEQAVQVFKAGKPVFIDKPIAATLPDAIAIFELARRYGVPCFSASSIRYTENCRDIEAGNYGRVLGADTYSPANIEPTHLLDLSWYGVHGIEPLRAVMGPGCVQVTRVFSEGSDVAVGLWDDGRIGTFRGNREIQTGYSGRAFTEKGVISTGESVPYDFLLGEIIRFFETGIAPVSETETLEIFTFMEAARQSKEKGGVPVATAKVFEEAQRAAEKILKAY